MATTDATVTGKHVGLDEKGPANPASPETAPAAADKGASSARTPRTRQQLAARSRSTPMTSARSSNLSARSLRSTGTIPISERPKWDDTPLRARPPALRGLTNLTEPWARDEIVYNDRFNMRSEYTGDFDLEERTAYLPHRMRYIEIRRTDYTNRWQEKFLDKLVSA